MLIACPAGVVAQSVDQQSGLSNASADDRVDFGRDIRPLFQSHCNSCHGREKQESNYRLDTKSAALGTGDYGDPPIIPGDSAESPLIQFVSGAGDLLMPPPDSGKQLSGQQVDLLRRWIDQGANWPDELAGDSDQTLSTDHWSFQPLADSRPPIVDDLAMGDFRPHNEIDAFVARRLAENGLRPSAPADRVTFIRRLYQDMHGLYPTPSQVRDFVEDRSDQAYRTVIDDVLASHHYGQRWARHWLDVVRFGESTGYEVNRDRSNAWYYRDYVIDALNADKSYRDFVVEQLAGDALGVDEANGFLVGGPNDIVKSPDINLTLMQRQDELADYVNTTGTTFLGLTIGCARCHNHKFDPILQRDYYSMQAFFAGVRHGERKLMNRASDELRNRLAALRSGLASHEQGFAELRAIAPEPESVSGHLREMVNAKQNTEIFEPVSARFLRFTILQTNQYEPCIDELEVFSSADNQNVALATRGTSVQSSGDYANDPKHQLPHINDGKYGNNHSWISSTVGSGWVQVEFPELVSIDRVQWGRDRAGEYADRLAIQYSISVSVDGSSWTAVADSQSRKPFLVNGQEPEDAFIARLPEADSKRAREIYERIRSMREEIAGLEKSIPVAYVGTFVTPEPVHRLHRGEPLAKREEVAPDVLTVMGSLSLDTDTEEQTRRLKLARWIASNDNPLTARVIVNRVWHYHFGQGIVATPSDFGKNGALPTHPELLDWLARRFMENEWSLKWLHREILSSATYQQSSIPRTDALAKDADCRWLWRFPPRRLEAEAIRDCVLQVSGKLNSKVGGPGFLLFEVDRENVHHYFPLNKFEPEHFRRMIYMTKIRQEQDDVFGAFDCPDGGQTIPDRSRSTTALQALNLLNSRFMIDQAGFLADRLRQESGEDPDSQILRAYQLTFSRAPVSEELTDARGFVDAHGLEAFCRALLNANEFLFVN